MAALQLFISLTMPFHLPEILGICVQEMWHDPFSFHFFPVTAPVNAPLVSSAGGPTLACYVWRTVYYDTDKANERDDNVTSINFL
jgi:hypothetical protein